MKIKINDKEVVKIFNHIDALADTMIKFLSDIIHEPAIGPMSGGNGETNKAKVIERNLLELGFNNLLHFDAPDDRVESKIRPNIQVTIKGESSKQRIVIITHMDIVSEGEIKDWDSNPFILNERDGKLFGRGVEDNGQSLTASIFAAKTLIDLGIQAKFDIILFFVSDEEESNEKGIKYLIKNNLINKSDLILVPDHGEPKGLLIDINEKTILWVKVTTKGKQCHASMPNLGKNAFRASMQLGCMLDEILHEKFNIKDNTFDYPFSSFEATKKENRKSGINVIPEEEIFYLDCRLLPFYKTKEVLDEINNLAHLIEIKTQTKITIEPVFIEETKYPTTEDSKIVKAISKAIHKVTNKKAICGSIGGGTCASVLRNEGFEVAVWETIENTAHSPNEYIRINNLLNDSKIFTLLFLNTDF